MKILGYCATIGLFALGAPASLARVPGSIHFLDSCPGDTITAQARPLTESLLGGVLTAVLPGIVNRGLKSAGERLKAIAEEAQVDIVQTGDHFYVVRAGEKLELKHKCMILIAQGNAKTKRPLSQLIDTYRSIRTDKSAAGGIERTWIAPDAESKKKFAELILSSGFSADIDPALIAVFDIDLSQPMTEARLIPRFVSFDHSIREKREDSYARDITFEISMRAPSSEVAFSKTIVKIEGIRPGTTRVRRSSDIEEGDGLTAAQERLAEVGQWFTLPPVNDPTKQKLAAATAARKAVSSESATSNASRLSVNAFAATVGEKPLGNNCESKSTSLELAATTKVRLFRATEGKNAALARYLTELQTYYESCVKLRDAEAESASASFLEPNNSVGAFDVLIAIKEFRDRPVAKFFGDVLSDDPTRTGLSKLIVDELDPAARSASAKADSDANEKLRLEYEGALVKAWLAADVHERAKPEEVNARFIEMRAAQRAANRLAVRLGIELPFPEAGTWIAG